MQDIKTLVYQLVQEIREKESFSSMMIKDKHRLVDDLGLASLDVAELIASLEIELGIDPFGDGTASITDISNIGSLCSVYESAYNQSVE